MDANVGYQSPMQERLQKIIARGRTIAPAVTQSNNRQRPSRGNGMSLPNSAVELVEPNPRRRIDRSRRKSNHSGRAPCAPFVINKPPKSSPPCAIPKAADAAPISCAASPRRGSGGPPRLRRGPASDSFSTNDWRPRRRDASRRKNLSSDIT